MRLLLRRADEFAMTKISDCISIVFPKLSNIRGSLSVIEENKNSPFLIKRVFYLYDLPKGEKRGVHALKETKEVVIPLSGSFEVTLDDGTDKKTIFLDQSNVGLYIPPGIWRELKNFSPNTIVLALASTAFSSDDYILDYEAFKKMAKSGQL